MLVSVSFQQVAQRVRTKIFLVTFGTTFVFIRASEWLRLGRSCKLPITVAIEFVGKNC